MDIGLFAFLAVMNIATINIYVWVFGWTYAFSSLKHTPRNGIAVFKLILLTDCQTVLKQLHHFTFPSAVWEVPNFSISLPTLVIFSLPFFITTSLVDVKWNLTVVLTCVSLMAHEAAHLFMCLLVICIFSLDQYLFKSFVHFFSCSYYWSLDYF